MPPTKLTTLHSGDKQFVTHLGDLGMVPIHILNENSEYGPDDLSEVSFTLKNRTIAFESLDQTAIDKLIKSMAFGLLKPKIALQALAHLTREDVRRIALLPRFNTHLPVGYEGDHGDETFYPISFTDSIDTENKQLGAYVSASYSAASESPPPNTTIKKYVSAGCMFGTRLCATDNKGRTFALIKHKHNLGVGDKILDVSVQGDNSYYELTHFIQFTSIANLINRFAAPNTVKELDYHLPYYDYVMYGVQLFLYDQISAKALKSFFKHIYDCKIQHIEKIEEICHVRGIHVQIASPFDNLFKPKSNSKDDFIASIYEALPFLQEGQKKPTEAQCVASCLVKLMDTQGTKPQHANIWQLYVNELGYNNVQNIDGLFNLANTLMISAASMGRKDYETLSLLPFCEEQIQILNRKLTTDSMQKKVALVKVCHLLVLEQAPGYSVSNVYNGFSFYLQDPDLIKFFPEIEQRMHAASIRTGELASLMPADEFDAKFDAYHEEAQLAIMEKIASASRMTMINVHQLTGKSGTDLYDSTSVASSYSSDNSSSKTMTYTS